MSELYYSRLLQPPDPDFSCGVTTIDQTIQQSHILVILRRCYAYSVMSKDKLLGYYMVSLKRFSVETFYPPVEDHFIEPYQDLYALNIDYIAVNKKYQRNQIGTTILQNILDDAENLMKFCPIRLITLDALEERIPWYRKFGFKKAKHPNTDNATATLMYYDMVSPEDIDLAEEYAVSCF